MMRSRPSAGLLLAICAIGLSTAGCTRLRGHQGYVVDADLVNSVQPGVDTRATVAKVLGQPTLAGQFDSGDWYYVSRDTRYFAYKKPKPKDQIVLHISFDDKGVVSAVNRTGMEQVASIAPYGKVTPTLGRHRTFFQDLFGNIGQVGAGAAGAGSGDGNGP